MNQNDETYQARGTLIYMSYLQTLFSAVPNIVVELLTFTFDSIETLHKAFSNIPS